MATSTNLIIYLIIVATCCVPETSGLTFNLAEIGPHNNKEILTEGNGTYISSDGIQLVKPPLSSSSAVQNETRAGRATYVDLLHLWDSASGQLVDFTTNFSLFLNSGDGVSFFLAEKTSLVTASGAMGLPVVVLNGSDTPVMPFVAVEFDTRWNSNWDPVDGRYQPVGDHVGINVNSLVSSEYEKWWSNVTYGKECFAKIQYDSVSQNLSVHYRGTMVADEYELHHTVDLRNVLPEFVVFGFSSSSSSGDQFHRNSVRSWFFNSTVLHTDEMRSRKKEKKTTVIMVSLVIVIVIIGLFLCMTIIKNCSRQVPSAAESWALREFTFKELKIATNNFDSCQMLGKGGFGEVYKATLANGEMVAVKKIPRASQEGIKEFEAEVRIVGGARHKNLVKLIGWCNERNKVLLVVYELMENISLDIHIFNLSMDPLPWDTRYKIAHGLAKALRYLHEECGESCILHRDIKASNVLLDSNFEAKLGDFGLAKLIDHDRSLEISVLAGTRGYVAPECFQVGRASPKSDVYSYGVVALELATGRRRIYSNDEGDQVELVKWVEKMYRMKKIREIVDPRLDDYDDLQMKGLIALGLWCVRPDFNDRPLMREIVHALNNTQDPLLDLHQKIPSFDNPLELSPEIYLEIDLTEEGVAPSYPPLFIWPHFLFLSPLKFLLGSGWPLAHPYKTGN